MYTSKLKIKTSPVNAWRSLCWWPDLSDCLVTSSIPQGRPQKKPADHNCWDDGEARREDLGWHNKDVVYRRHWRQTGRGRRGTGVLRQAINSRQSRWLPDTIQHNTWYVIFPTNQQQKIIYLSVESSCNRPSDTGLANARRTIETQNLSLCATLQLAYCNEFLQRHLQHSVRQYTSKSQIRHMRLVLIMYKLLSYSNQMIK